jgi:hypothetical protein
MGRKAFGGFLTRKNMEYEVQYARITTTGKLADRFLNCQSKSCSDLAKAYMGTFYSLVEIKSPWFTTSQVGQSIINTFYQTYYNGESTSDLDNFEEALKAVNENLTKISQNGETSWIGNLNAILAIQIENKILMAQTGHAEAYIFRQGKTNHLTYGLDQGQVETHPSKTFSNITSGELKQRDKVLIANPDLFISLDMDTLREIITLNTPNEAILQISKILKKKKSRSVNVLILELMSLEDASQLPVTNLSDNIHLDRPAESTRVPLEKFWQLFLLPVLRFIVKYLQIFGQKIFDLTKSYIQKAKRAKNLAPIKSDQFHQDFIQPSTSDEGLLKDEQIEYSPELSIHYYEQAKKKEQKQNAKLSLFLNKASKLLSLSIVWCTNIWQQKKNRPYFLGGLGLIILVVLIIVISGHSHNTVTKMSLLQAQTILKSAQTSQNSARADLASSNNEKAKSDFKVCIQQSEKVMSVEILKQDASSSYNSCQSALDSLTNTTRFANLKPVASVTNALVGGIKSVYIFDSQIYLVDSGAIYKTDINGSNPEKVASLPRNNGDIQFGTSDSQSIYLYTSTQQVYKYSIRDNSFVLAQINGDWETANAAFSYNNALYLLNGITGQIYKHPLGSAGFTAGQSYLNSGADSLKNSISLAIDGSVYALNSSGKVIEAQSGKVQSSFSLQNIPTPDSQIAGPVKIYTNTDSASLYVLDSAKKRIIEFDKNGNFIHQYALPTSFNNLTDFVVSTKTKNIWFLNQNSLYQISI